MIYLAHKGEAAHFLPSGGVAVPVRVESIGEWAGGNATVTIRVTAPRTADGVGYNVGAKFTVHGNAVRPNTATEPTDGWVWCDGKNHGDPCPECRDIHRVHLGIPGRAMGGVWVPGCEVVRCRACNRLMRYLSTR